MVLGLPMATRLPGAEGAEGTERAACGRPFAGWGVGRGWICRRRGGEARRNMGIVFGLRIATRLPGAEGAEGTERAACGRPFAGGGVGRGWVCRRRGGEARRNMGIVFGLRIATRLPGAEGEESTERAACGRPFAGGCGERIH